MTSKIALFTLCLFTVFASGAETPDLELPNVEFKYQKIFANSSIPHEPLLRLLTYYDQHREKIGNQEYLTFVDYSLASNQPRFYLIDLRDGSVQKFLVAHGKGSDPRYTGRARYFSNAPNSYASSLGIYLTDQKPYYGENGYSLRLIGLDKTNSNAWQRALLVHGQTYVSAGRPVLGRSWGCFALEESYARDVIDKIKGGSLIMAWIDPKLAAHFWSGSESNSRATFMKTNSP